MSLYIYICHYIYIYHYISPLDTNKINDFSMFSPPFLHHFSKVGGGLAIGQGRRGKTQGEGVPAQGFTEKVLIFSSVTWGFTMKNRLNIWAFMVISWGFRPGDLPL